MELRNTCDNDIYIYRILQITSQPRVLNKSDIIYTCSALVESGGSLSELKAALPQYFIAKRKIELEKTNPDIIIDALTNKYKNEKINTEDGLRIDFPDHWVHFRKSNTEPIIRCITEAKYQDEAEKYIDKYFTEIKLLF